MLNLYKKGTIDLRSELLDGTSLARSSPRASQSNKTGATVEGSIKLLDTILLPKDFMSCSFNPDGDLLAVALSNGVIKIYSMESNSFVYSISNENSELPATCLQWKPNIDGQTYKNVLIATYASGDVRQWHVSSGQCLWKDKEDRQLLTCAVSYDASRLLTSGSDAKIMMYDASTKQQLNTFESSPKFESMDGHTMRVFAVKFQPLDSNVFVSGGWDDTLQWWDCRQNAIHSIRRISGPHICGEGLDIEPETLKVVTGSWRKDNNIQVWDFHSGNLIADVPSDFNRSMIYSVQWKDKETIIAGGSHCNMLRFINSRTQTTNARLVDLEGAVFSIDSNRIGPQPTVAAGCAETLHLVQGT